MWAIRVHMIFLIKDMRLQFLCSRSQYLEISVSWGSPFATKPISFQIDSLVSTSCWHFNFNKNIIHIHKLQFSQTRKIKNRMFSGSSIHFLPSRLCFLDGYFTFSFFNILIFLHTQIILKAGSKLQVLHPNSFTLVKYINWIDQLFLL